MFFLLALFISSVITFIKIIGLGRVLWKVVVGCGVGVCFHVCVLYVISLVFVLICEGQNLREFCF